MSFHPEIDHVLVSRPWNLRKISPDPVTIPCVVQQWIPALLNIARTEPVWRWQAWRVGWTKRESSQTKNWPSYKYMWISVIYIFCVNIDISPCIIICHLHIYVYICIYIHVWSWEYIYIYIHTFTCDAMQYRCDVSLVNMKKNKRIQRGCQVAIKGKILKKAQ